MSRRAGKDRAAESTGTVTPVQVSRDDLENKFRELAGEVDETKQSVQSYVLVAGAVVAVVVIALAFTLGKRRGKKKRTFVEVRRL